MIGLATPVIFRLIFGIGSLLISFGAATYVYSKYQHYQELKRQAPIQAQKLERAEAEINFLHEKNANQAKVLIAYGKRNKSISDRHRKAAEGFAEDSRNSEEVRQWELGIIPDLTDQRLCELEAQYGNDHCGKKDRSGAAGPVSDSDKNRP